MFFQKIPIYYLCPRDAVWGNWDIQIMKRPTVHTRSFNIHCAVGVQRNNCIQWSTHHHRGRSKRSPLVRSDQRGPKRRGGDVLREKPEFTNQQATEWVGKWMGESVPSRKTKSCSKSKMSGGNEDGAFRELHVLFALTKIKPTMQPAHQQQQPPSVNNPAVYLTSPALQWRHYFHFMDEQTEAQRFFKMYPTSVN